MKISKWDKHIDGYKIKLIKHYIIKHNHQITPAAKELGITKQLLDYQLKKYELKHELRIGHKRKIFPRE